MKNKLKKKIIRNISSQHNDSPIETFFKQMTVKILPESTQFFFNSYRHVQKTKRVFQIWRHIHGLLHIAVTLRQCKLFGESQLTKGFLFSINLSPASMASTPLSKQKDFQCTINITVRFDLYIFEISRQCIAMFCV